jgi:hypothetical protein
MWTVDLRTRPALSRPTLRLLRPMDGSRIHVLSTQPCFARSHWRRCRSFPCTKSWIEECPFCDHASSREHAYLIGHPWTHNKQPSLYVIDLPAAAFLKALEQHTYDTIAGTQLEIRRPAKHATPQILIYRSTDVDEKSAPLPEQTEVLRTLCKVYSLPDPESYATRQAWNLAIKLRISDPEYSPSRRQPPAE